MNVGTDEPAGAVRALPRTLLVIGTIALFVVGLWLGWQAAFWTLDAPAFPLTPLLLLAALAGCCYLARTRRLIASLTIGTLCGAFTGLALVAWLAWALRNF